MSKMTDAAKAAIVAVFENGDVPDATNFAAMIEAIQEAAQDHEHNAGGGTGSGTGDASKVAYPGGISGMFLDGALSPMILTGGAVSDGTNAGTLKVAALTALLRATTDADGVLTVVSKEEEDNIAITDPETVYRVVLQYNSGTPLIALQTGEPNGTTNIKIGSGMRNAANVRWHRCSGYRLADGVARLHERAAKLRTLELQSGLAISHVGTRSFATTEGHVYSGINNLLFPAYTSLGDKFTLVYYGDDPVAWEYVTDQTVIPNDNYNDYGANPGLVALASNEYGCFWVYAVPCENEVYVVYGRSSNKLAAAEVEQPPATLPLFLSEFGVLVGCVIIKESGADFAVIQMVTDRFFVGTAVADHGEQSGLDDDDHSVVYHAKGNFLASSAGEEDAGKPVKLNAAGEIDATMGGGGGGSTLVLVGPPFPMTASTGIADTIVDGLIFVPIWVPQAVTIDALRIIVMTSAGNIDVGIYDSDKDKVISTGSIACPAAGTRDLAIADTELAVGWYMFAIGATNYSVRILGFATHGSSAWSNQVQSVYPLPSAYTTFDDVTEEVPLIWGVVK